MNIAVLGSNCKFSSDLAVKLNQLKETSLIFRYDILSDFKRNVPLYRSLFKTNKKATEKALTVENNEEEMDDEENIPTPAIISKGTPLGEYVGDVETKFIENFDGIIERVEKLRSIYSVLNTKVGDTPTYGEQQTRSKMSECLLNSSLFKANVLNIINVYSGILDANSLKTLLNNSAMMIVIKVANKDTLLPCVITDSELEDIIQRNPRTLVIETSSIEELLKDDSFLKLMNVKQKQKTTEAKVVKIESVPTIEEAVDAALQQAVANPYAIAA